MKLNKEIFFYLIIAFAFVCRFLPLRSSFKSSFDFQQISEKYRYSQFAVDPNDRQVIIEDWELYPYAGLVYLKTGILDQVNIEHPPLGKYFFALSTLIFKNPNIVQLPFAIFFLWLIFRISLRCLQNHFWALLVVFGVLAEFLFSHRLTHSLLDLFQATMVSWFIFLGTVKKSALGKKIFLGLILGAVASVKFPVVAIILTGSYLIKQYFLRNKSLKRILEKESLIILIGFLFYLFNYSPLFIQNGIAGFFQLQVRAVKIHLSHLPEYPALVPLRVMFLNQWPVWWDKINPIHPAEEWNFLWPALASSILITPLFFFKCLSPRQKRKSLLIFLFSWAYFVFINTRLFFPGYLFLILPCLYLFLLWQIKYLLKLVKSML